MKTLKNPQHKPRLLSTLLSLFALMFLMATQASADVNVLIIGSTKDGGDSLGGTSDPFSPTAIATELQKILAGAGLGTANVEVEERYATGSDAFGTSYSYNLASWFHWPYPAGVETTTRWPKLRGEPYPGNTTGTPWDYVILIGDPYTMENYPGLYAHGVAMIGQEVAKGTAETVLLMNWPAAGSTSSVAHYKEVVYRAGRTGGYKVAPAALAWEADGKSTNATRRAFICASSLYSTIWGQSASASTYSYNDTLADTVHTNTTTNNNIAQPYTGFKMDFQNPWLMLGDKRRDIHFSEKGTSTESYYANTLRNILPIAGVTYNDSYRDTYSSNTPQDDGNAIWTNNPMPIAWNHGRDGDPVKGYVVNPDYWQLAFTFDFQLKSYDYPVADANDFCTARIFSGEVAQANNIKGIDPSIRNAAWRLMWGQIHKQYPDQRPVRDNAWHVNTCVEQAVGAFIYTLYSGRCPINPNDDGNLNGYSRRIGYETAWRLGTGSSRAPGFKVMPSASTAVTVTPSTTETMTVQFLFPPKHDVTVTVSSSDTSAAIVGPQKLVFTPTNYNVPQSVKVAGVAGSTASAPFKVDYTTSSADPAYEGLSDSWAYTCERTPTSVTQVNRGTTQYSTPKNFPVSINLNASGANASNTTFAGPNKGTLSWNGGNVIYTPNTDYIGSDGFAFASLNGGTLTIGYIDIDVVNAYPDGSVRAEVTDANAAEQGNDPGTITITRQGATASSLSVNFTISGSATLSSDYTLSASSPITIPAGQSSVVVTLTPVDDTVFGERIETATLTIAAGSGYTAITNPATISIADNDNRAPVVSAGTNQTVTLQAGEVITPGWNHAAWTGDADSGIDSANTYTAKHCFGDNNAGSVTVNGVSFVESFATSGTGWSLTGSVTNWTGNDDASISGNSEKLAQEFIYNGNPRTVTFSGLTPGQSYEANFYSAGWEAGDRSQTFSATGTGITNAVINQNQYGNNNGIRIRYVYTATATTQQFVITPTGTSIGTLHLYALSNRQLVTQSATVNLNGSATDADSDPLTMTWSVVSKNPSTAANPIFANAAQPITTATFTEAGTYTLRLSVNDGYVTRTSDVTITVVDNTPTYALTVTSGSGDGTYASGAQVTITADAPASGYRFVNWTSSGGGSFANSNSSTTTFTMPTNAATVTANYALNTAPVVNAGADQTVALQGVAGPEQMILAATDSIQGFRTAVVGGNTTAGVSGTDWPTAESPPKAIDGSTSTKYLNYGKVGSGFYVTPAAGATTLTGVRIYTANDASGRDPLTISIEGSNGGDLNQGSSWTLIQDNINLGINTDPGRLKAGPLVSLSATASYTSYRIIVKSQRGADNSVQYSELQLHGFTGTATTVNLSGSATDADGDSLTTTWSVVSKNPVTAANPTFANAAQPITTATFTAEGTYVLRLSANDGYTTSTDDITIKVNPPLPSKYASWAGGTFAKPFTDTALTSNPDGDSMNNLMEFAFGTDPTLSSEGTLAIDGSKNGSPTLIKNGGNFDYYFVRRKDHGTSGSVSYTPQFSNNLTSFTNSTDTPIWVANSASNPTLYEVVKVPFPNGTKFGRLEIKEVP